LVDFLRVNLADCRGPERQSPDHSGKTGTDGIRHP
jgi:hypothetical protein